MCFHSMIHSRLAAGEQYQVMPHMVFCILAKKATHSSLGCGCSMTGRVVVQAGVHPEQPGRTVSRQGFESLWRHSVLLLQRGFKTGSILTVDEDEAKKLGKPWTRRLSCCHILSTTIVLHYIHFCCQLTTTIAVLLHLQAWACCPVSARAFSW